MNSYLILLAAVAVTVPAGASAQERRYSGEQVQHAMQACREAVRQQAVDRFGGRAIEFRDAHFDPDGDAVAGMVDIPRGGYEDHFRFTCSMDADRDAVRSVRINPVGEGAEGYRERAMGTDRAMDNCRSAVAGRIADQGYRGVQFDSMHIDDRSSRGDRIAGSAHARRGDDVHSFHFACSVELRDGDLRSVDVTRR
jgi:hypothetical protein